jgi:hypothetical protein
MAGYRVPSSPGNCRDEPVSASYSTLFDRNISGASLVNV